MTKLWKKKTNTSFRNFLFLHFPPKIKYSPFHLPFLPTILNIKLHNFTALEKKEEKKLEYFPRSEHFWLISVKGISISRYAPNGKNNKEWNIKISRRCWTLVRNSFNEGNAKRFPFFLFYKLELNTLYEFYWNPAHTSFAFYFLIDLSRIYVWNTIVIANKKFPILII